MPMTKEHSVVKAYHTAIAREGYDVTIPRKVTAGRTQAGLTTCARVCAKYNRHRTLWQLGYTVLTSQRSSQWRH